MQYQSVSLAPSRKGAAAEIAAPRHSPEQKIYFYMSSLCSSPCRWWACRNLWCCSPGRTWSSPCTPPRRSALRCTRSQIHPVWETSRQTSDDLKRLWTIHIFVVLAKVPLKVPSWCPADWSGPSPCRASWWSWCRGRDVWWSPGYSSAPRWDTPEGGTRTAACGSDTRTRTRTASRPSACSYTWGSRRCLRCRPEPFRRVCWPAGSKISFIYSWIQNPLLMYWLFLYL